MTLVTDDLTKEALLDFDIACHLETNGTSLYLDGSLDITQNSLKCFYSEDHFLSVLDPPLLKDTLTFNVSIQI